MIYSSIKDYTRCSLRENIFFQEINASCCLINGNDFDSKAKCYQMEHVVRTIFGASVELTLKFFVLLQLSL